jgi:hypothetical protein
MNTVMKNVLLIVTYTRDVVLNALMMIIALMLTGEILPINWTNATMISVLEKLMMMTTIVQLMKIVTSLVDLLALSTPKSVFNVLLMDTVMETP